MNDLSLLSPETVVHLGRTPVAVRELSWPDALSLFARLADTTALLVTPDGKLKPVADLVRLLAEQGEGHVVWLLARSTTLPAEAIPRLPASAVVRLLEATISLTLNDEVLAAGNVLAGRVRQAFRPKATTLTTPSVRPASS
jgi:hypothetical protein